MAPRPAEVVAVGCEAWIGWVDQVNVRVDELATTHTARGIGDVDAEIIAGIEAESRTELHQAGILGDVECAAAKSRVLGL